MDKSPATNTLELNKGFLFENKNKWFIVSKDGIYPLHPKDVEDPMMCLKHNELITYNYCDYSTEQNKPYARIQNFL